MIVGHGAIAKALKDCDQDGRLYFASGVSNSRETRDSEFERELDLLISQNKARRVVYFSSLCVFSSQTVYSDHKWRMERFVKSFFDRWTIMRLGNIAWAENPNQLIPWLRNWDGKTTLDDQYRHLLTKDEFLYWVGLIPDWNCELNVTGARLKPIEIIDGWKRHELAHTQHRW